MLCQDECKISRNTNYIKAVLIFQDMLCYESRISRMLQDMPCFESKICSINSLKFPWLVELSFRVGVVAIDTSSSFNVSPLL
ncbi:hypothetical protein Peur_069343 [Populus x canadensis]